MREIHRKVIIDSEHIYERFILTGEVDPSQDLSKLTEAVMYFGREYPNELVHKFIKENPENIFDQEQTMKKIIGFLSVVLVNGVKTVEDFNGMSLRSLYTYITKRMVFNKQYLVNCPSYHFFVQLLQSIDDNTVDLIPFTDYIEGL